MHRATQIRDRIYIKLSALVGSAISEVKKSNIELSESYPSISISLGSDTPVTENSTFLDSQLMVYTDVLLKTTDADVDGQTQAIRKEIHKALMQELNLGLGYVLKVTPRGQQEPEQNNDSDFNLSATRLVWSVMYRTSYTDPSL